MPFIVAKNTNFLPGFPFDGEIPVLSFTCGHKGEDILENVSHYADVEAPPSIQQKYAGAPPNKEDFKIGSCHFIKQGSTWFFEDRFKKLFPIVYGDRALDMYADGSIFKIP